MARQQLLVTAFVLIVLACVTECNRLDYHQNTSSSTPPQVSVQQERHLNCSSSDEVTHCTVPWTYCDNATCKCGTISQDILQCHLHRNPTISHCHCVTYSKETGATQAGKCIFLCGFSGKNYSTHWHQVLPNSVTELDNHICAPFNRTGALCGSCRRNHYPLVHSFDMTCVECPNGKANWWKFVLAAFLPLTVFFFLILFFNINITSSHFHGFIWYSQGVATPALARAAIITIRHSKNTQTGVRVILAFFGIWNLDFFRSMDLGICLGTDVLQTLALDLAVGLYPLLLLVVTYCLIHLYDRNLRVLVVLWRPFRTMFSHLRRGWDIRTSLIDSFAAFFLLSNVKFLNISFDLLTPVQVFQLKPNTREPTSTWRLFYDSDLPYFGEEHLPYAILAIVVLAFLLILPVLLLILYPFRWFQRLLNLFPFRWYVLHTFMDSFHGCYKNGTQPGTRDCRWFVSAYFILRFLVILIGQFTLDSMFYPPAAILVSLLILLAVNLSPFKDDVNRYGAVNVMFLLLLSLWYVSAIGLTNVDEFSDNMVYPFIIIMFLVVTLPHIYVSALVLHWTYSRRKFGWELVRRLCAWRQGYQPVN